MTATTEPTQLRAGDSVAWTRTVDGCPASAGWVLAYRLVPRAAGTPIDIASSASGDDFVVSVARTTTAAWAAGAYSLVGVATKGTERVTVHSDDCTILPDLMSATAWDGRSTARQIVEAIDTYFRTRDRAVIEKQLGDRRLRFQTDAELIATRNFYATQLITEDAAAGLAAGIGMSPSRVQVRM